MQILRRFLAVSPPIVRFSSAMFAHFVNTQMLFFSLHVFLYKTASRFSSPSVERGRDV